VPQSVLDAIKSGNWNFEPQEFMAVNNFNSTSALPGTDQKLEVLAERIRNGLPLWHPEDRLTYDRTE
jgi:hypothetical protein